MDQFDVIFIRKEIMLWPASETFEIFLWETRSACASDSEWCEMEMRICYQIFWFIVYAAVCGAWWNGSGKRLACTRSLAQQHQEYIFFFHFIFISNSNTRDYRNSSSCLTQNDVYLYLNRGEMKRDIFWYPSAARCTHHTSLTTIRFHRSALHPGTGSLMSRSFENCMWPFDVKFCLRPHLSARMGKNDLVPIDADTEIKFLSNYL